MPRRLECLLAATCLQTFNEHVKIAGCLGGSVVAKPNDQRIGVGDGRFAKAEAGANLGTESFCSTRCQQLTITRRGRRVELLAQRINHSLLNCRFEPREPAATAEERQQHSEAEPRATVLGHRQGVVFGRQGPRFVRGPETAGHGVLAPEDGAVSVRASVSINVVRLTPKLRHTAAFDMPSSSAARMASSFSPTITGGRPPGRDAGQLSALPSPALV